MKLSDCKLGALVIEIENDLWRTANYTYARPRIGHVVGVDYNIDGDVNNFTKDDWRCAEVVPVVKFAGEDKPRKIHYKNIRRIEDGEEEQESNAIKLEKAIKIYAPKFETSILNLKTFYTKD
jgi:hypothetical protein